MAHLLTDTPLTLRRIDGLLVAVIPDELAQSLSLAEGDQVGLGKPPTSVANGEHDDDLEYAADYMTRHTRLFDVLSGTPNEPEDDLTRLAENYMDRHSEAFEQLAK